MSSSIPEDRSPFPFDDELAPLFHELEVRRHEREEARSIAERTRSTRDKSSRHPELIRSIVLRYRQDPDDDHLFYVLTSLVTFVVEGWGEQLYESWTVLSEKMAEDDASVIFDWASDFMLVGAFAALGVPDIAAMFVNDRDGYERRWNAGRKLAARGE